MRIGVNLRPLFPGKIGGLEPYFRCLFAAMLEQPGPEQYVVYGHEENLASLDFAAHPRVTLHPLASAHRVTDVALAVRDTRPDAVFHPFLFIEPTQLDAFNAVLIPDLRYLDHAAQIPAPQLRAWRRLFPETARRAEAILTLSEHSRGELVGRLGVDAARVTVASPAVDPLFLVPPASDALAAVRARHALPERFLYYPADTWPHKNHLRLLAALARLARRGLEIPLVLSGHAHAAEDAVARAAARLAGRVPVLRLGYVPRTEQPALYRLARGVVFPSLYEGWGMPVSEAMACGAPVACSRAASLPEVGGEHALYFDPCDEREMAAQIARLWEDEPLRARLSAAGPAQAAAVRWEDGARAALAALRSAGAPMAEVIDPLPLVSVVTPSYGQAAFIERTIESVLGQDYPHLEYLVVDGGSRDGTVEILKKYSHRLRWISRPDRGQSDAINQGLRAARGEILAYLNSDDTYLPGAVRTAVAHLTGNPSCDVVYGQGDYIDLEDRVIEPYPTEPFDEERLKTVCFISQPTAFWRRELHERIGYFDEGQHLVMDYDFWLRAARVARFAMLDEKLANTRLWAGAKTVGSNARQLLQAMEAVHRHHGEVPSAWIGNYVCVWLTGLPAGLKSGPLSLPMRRLLRLAMKTRLSARFNGVASLLATGEPGPVSAYVDGWMGRTLQQRLVVRSGARAIRVSGGLPVWPLERPLRLELAVDGHPAGQAVIPGTGRFAVDFPLPAECDDGGEALITLTASPTFVPADHAIGTDERRLGCHISGLEFIP